MGTCKLRAGDRRESVIGYRSTGAKASSGGDGLSNYPVRARRGQPIPPAPGEKSSVGCLGRSRRDAGWGGSAAGAAPSSSGAEDAPHAGAGDGTRITFPFASPRF